LLFKQFLCENTSQDGRRKYLYVFEVAIRWLSNRTGSAVDDVHASRGKQATRQADLPGGCTTMKGHFRSPRFTIVIVLAVSVCIGILLPLALFLPDNENMRVVEFGSMSHGEDSELGVLDAGDFAQVESVDSPGDIRTWQDGKEENYKNCGDYGDVIIYYMNGHTDDTPIIRRAIVLVKYNTTEGGRRFYDVPQWDLYHVTKIRYTFNQRGEEVQIHYNPEEPYDGYITKGDNNQYADQGVHGLTDNQNQPVKHVHIKWVGGVVTGEIPWFGILKLEYSGNENIEYVPDNSWTWLFISMFAINVLPTLIVIAITLIFRWKDSRNDDAIGLGNGKEETKPLSLKATPPPPKQ